VLAEQFARKQGIGNVQFFQMEPGNMAQIEELVDEHRPRVVLLDQIRNMQALKGGSNSTMTTRLEDNAIEFRNLASRYRFAGIGITQAGACDLMIGVGANQIMIDTNRRGISLPKNKLGHKHDAFIVTVDYERNKIT
jgi:hypothetical protein